MDSAFALDGESVIGGGVGAGVAVGSGVTEFDDGTAAALVVGGEVGGTAFGGGAGLGEGIGVAPGRS